MPRDDDPPRVLAATEPRNFMKPIFWRDGENAIALLPERGRVLQVEVRGQRAFWQPPAATDWNVGGDRLWVAPEAAWFWKTLQSVDFAQYEIPRALDPGQWQLVRSETDFCEMTQHVALPHQHKNRTYDFDLTRRFTRVVLREPPFPDCVAYHSENALDLNGAKAAQRDAQSIGLWSLLQVPIGGVMLVGVRSDAKWRDYFTPIARHLWSQDAGALHLQINGNEQYKIGLPPRALTGRAAYAREVGDATVVVLRQWEPQPCLPFCDAPMSDLHSAGDALQVYSDNGGAGSFGEMELHAPALRFDAASTRSVASSLTVVGVTTNDKWFAWRDEWLSGRCVVA